MKKLLLISALFAGYATIIDNTAALDLSSGNTHEKISTDYSKATEITDLLGLGKHCDTFSSLREQGNKICQERGSHGVSSKEITLMNLIQSSPHAKGSDIRALIDRRMNRQPVASITTFEVERLYQELIETIYMDKEGKQLKYRSNPARNMMAGTNQMTEAAIEAQLRQGNVPGAGHLVDQVTEQMIIGRLTQGEVIKTVDAIYYIDGTNLVKLPVGEFHEEKLGYNFEQNFDGTISEI